MNFLFSKNTDYLNIGKNETIEANVRSRTCKKFFRISSYLTDYFSWQESFLKISLSRIWIIGYINAFISWLLDEEA